jgi:hypothetical protein
MRFSATQVAQQNETKFMAIIVMNLVTPKVGAQHELLFNKPASVCCNYFCIEEYR